jgi:hypothetical protein
MTLKLSSKLNAGEQFRLPLAVLVVQPGHERTIKL